MRRSIFKVTIGRLWRLAIASAVVFSIAAVTGSERAWAAVSLGQPAPALTVVEFNGTPFNLGGHRGQVVVVNIWATWCGPCRLEMPALDAFYRQYHDRGVELIGLSVDGSRDRDKVIKTMEAFAYPAAMLNDAHPNGLGSPTVLPMTYVIDAAGIVRAQMKPSEKPITVKSLSEVVLPLLPEK